MIAENNEENRAISKVAASLAIDNMFLEKDFLEELIKVANGEKSLEELRQEVMEKFAR